MALALDAPAKVNLYLRVLGPRPDGYHEVVTVLHALALHDTVTAEIGPRVALSVDCEVATGSAVPADADNLVCRAARGFLAVSGVGGGFRFHLVKRVPAGGGLGGGSSDAAQALRLMNALHRFPLDPAGLHRLAADLGADVPFFLEGGTQLGRGVGTELSPLRGAPQWHFVLILPAIGTSTAAVYKNRGAALTGGGPQAMVPPDKVLDYKDLALPPGFPNDLETSALRLHPELADIRNRVVDCGYRQVRLSGSGSTFFLAVKDELQSADVMDTLAPLQDRGVVLVQTESSVGQLGEPRPVSFPGGS